MTAPETALPAERLRLANDRPLRRDGAFVLYWMTAQRRLVWNHALDRAIELAEHLQRPLLVLEALRAGHPWAADRHHRFVLEGMQDNRSAADGTAVAYHPYVEPEPGAGKGLLKALGREACAVVTDEYPCYFLPRMVAAAARMLPVRLEVVDSCGVLPLRQADKAFPTAYAFRRHLQREFRGAWAAPPRKRPLPTLDLPALDELPATLRGDHPAADLDDLDGLIAGLPIDHSVGAVDKPGGTRAARRLLKAFVDQHLDDYHERRNHPDEEASSGLSPHLHYGHVSAFEVVQRVADHCLWKPEDLSDKADGRREGWWGSMSTGAQSFLDQVLTWRELGYGFAWHRKDHARWSSLPDWAQESLDQHADDPRDPVYTRSQLERAETHDEVWNAAQRELRREGVITNYLRMLWGKNILRWSTSPREALKTLIHLNDKYALDGRDPNSYTGIFWVLGRHDRPWGPRRPIFGTVRYMTSAQSKRKLQCKEYLERYGSATPPLHSTP